MALILVLAAMSVGIMVGLVFGYGLSQQRSKEAVHAERYRRALALLQDLINDPDALNLHDRASKILSEHRQATQPKGKS